GWAPAGRPRCGRGGGSSFRGCRGGRPLPSRCRWITSPRRSSRPTRSRRWPSRFGARTSSPCRPRCEANGRARTPIRGSIATAAESRTREEIDMRKYVLGLSLLAATLAPVAAQAGPDMGGGPPFMHGGMHGPFHDQMLVGDDPGLMLPALLQGVGLSDDQKKQIQEILKTNRTALFALFGQLRTANQALADKLISTGPLTKADLQPL